jgi:hypothetical protein
MPIGESSRILNQKRGTPVIPPVQVMTAAGAITLTSGGVVFAGTAGALALTLANPPTTADGATLTIVATTAQAHTVTYTAGFNGGTTARDVATFGGAIGDAMQVVAYNGVWWTVSLRNVTLG